MIYWTNEFPRKEQPRALLRFLKAHYCFFDQPKLILRRSLKPKLAWNIGYQTKLAELRDTLKNKPCVIAAGGASLASCDFQKLANYPIITCNGTYKILNENGIVPHFFCMEDIDQVEKRRTEWPNINAKVKLAALHNSYAITADENTIFFYASRHWKGDYFWNTDPRPFTTDFALVSYLGGSIVYVMLQLAYHLGCNPVYIIGLDHSYRSVIDLLGISEVNHENRFVRVTPENLAIIEKLHPSKGYFSVGEIIALPFVEEQERNFRVAQKAFTDKGKVIINATPGSQLDVFPAGEIPDFHQS